MKKTALIFSLFIVSASLHAQISVVPPVPPAPQSAPSAIRSENSAAPQKLNVPPPANPVPPVYSGAEPVPVVIPRDLVYPAAPPAPTQPAQREPLTPIESTNQLQPARPQRDQQSRDNSVNGRPAAVIPDNRVNKNELRAAGTVEDKQQIRNTGIVYPPRTDTAGRAAAAPVKSRRQTG